MPVVGCPQCGARVRKPESGKPICPRCGYGKRAPGSGVLGAQPLTVAGAAVLLVPAGVLVAVAVLAAAGHPVWRPGGLEGVTFWVVAAVAALWGLAHVLADIGLWRRRPGALGFASVLALLGLVGSVAACAVGVAGTWFDAGQAGLAVVVLGGVGYVATGGLTWLLYTYSARDWFHAKVKGQGPTGPLRSAFGDPRAGGKMDLPITASGRVMSPAGRARDPLQALLLMHGTLGVYWLYWTLQAFYELSRLHRRTHPVLLYVAGLLLWPLLLLYLFREVAMLNEYRKQRNMRESLTWLRFAVYYLLGWLAVAVFAMIDVLWVPDPWGTTLSGVGIVTFLGLSGWMHFKVQESMNRIWKNSGVSA